jgi:hypothetical protein
MQFIKTIGSLTAKTVNTVKKGDIMPALRKAKDEFKQGYESAQRESFNKSNGVTKS